MNKVRIGIKEDGQKFCQYNTIDTKLPDDISFYIIKEISDEQLQEIINCSSNKVQEILSKYINKI